MLKSVRLLNSIYFSGDIGLQIHALNTGLIPSIKSIKDYDKDRWEDLVKYILSTYEWEKDQKIETERIQPDGSLEKTIYLFLESKISISNSRGAKLIYDSSSNPEVLDDLKKRFEELQPNDTTNTIGIIRDGGGFLEVKSFKYSLPKQCIIGCLDKSTQDFQESIIDQLGSRDGSGLYVLYGKPGTGKTSFIKNVLSKTSKKVLFISPCFTEELTSPNLISLLMDYPDSILVIEDAETVLMERKADNSSAVSNLLNLTDGFLADFLNLKIICTFNTELNNIDEALLREGRLKGMHKFKKIQPERAKKIAEVLGCDIHAQKPMTLAEICAEKKTSNDFKPIKIGFDSPF